MSAARANVVLFTGHLARSPLASGGLLDNATWHRCWLQANVADWWRDHDPATADAAVREMINEQGHHVLARVIEQNADAIGAMRAMLATLIEADRRLTTAADRVLQARGA